MQTLLVRLFGWRSLPLHGDPTLRDRWRWVRSRLPRAPSRILDAGSGTGNIATCTVKLGHRVTGLSFTGPWNDVARRRAALLGAEDLEIVDFDLRELAEEGQRFGTFDAVLCLELVEHVSDDHALVARLADRLEPGGRLLLTTPFIDHRRLLGERVSEQEDGGHVRYGYSEADVRELLTQAGLEVEEVGFVSGVVSQQLTNLMRLLKRVSYPVAWAVTFPLRILQLVDRPLTNLMRAPYLSIAAVARRPEDR